MKLRYLRRFPPEVIHRIFQILDSNSKGKLQFKFALVAKDWFHNWIPFGWRQIQDVHQVLVMLTHGELRFPNPKSSQVIMRVPTIEDWRRFETTYAPHVKEVVIQPNPKYRPLCRAPAIRGLFIDILYGLLRKRYPKTARTKRPTDSKARQIFPNLRTVTLAYLCHAKIAKMVDFLVDLAVMMAHPGVTQFQVVDSVRQLEKHVTIDFNYQGLSLFEDGLVEVHLSGFVVRGRREYKKWLKFIGHAWEKTNAQSIRLPVSPAIVEELVRRGWNVPMEKLLITNTVRNPYGLKNFPILNLPISKVLGVYLELDLVAAVKFLDGMMACGAAKKLEEIHFDLKYNGTKPDGVQEAMAIRRLFRTIAKCAPELRFLDIVIHPEKSTILGPSELIETKRPIHFSSCRPLRGCEKLRVLSIRDIYPIVMDNREMVRLVNSWKDLESVTFAPSEYAATGWVEIKKEWMKLGSIKTFDVDHVIQDSLAKRFPEIRVIGQQSESRRVGRVKPK